MSRIVESVEHTTSVNAFGLQRQSGPPEIKLRGPLVREERGGISGQRHAPTV
jgi:hypothetical protein